MPGSVYIKKRESAREKRKKKKKNRVLSFDCKSAANNTCHIYMLCSLGAILFFGGGFCDVL